MPLHHPHHPHTHAAKGAATSRHNNQDTAISNLHFSIRDPEARWTGKCMQTWGKQSDLFSYRESLLSRGPFPGWRTSKASLELWQVGHHEESAYPPCVPIIQPRSNCFGLSSCQKLGQQKLMGVRVDLLTAEGRGEEKRLSVSDDRVRCRLCSRCDRPPRKYSEKWSGNPSLWTPPEPPPSESHTWELCLLGSAPTVMTGLLPCNSAHWKPEKRKRELIFLLDWYSSLLFIIEGEEIERTDGDGGVLQTARSCLRAIDIFGDPRKPGRAGHLTRCPGSMGPSGTREVQATREQFAVFNWLESAGLR